MSSGPRGLAPRGVWRLLRDPGGAFLLDDDTDRVPVGHRSAKVLELLGRRGGGVPTGELVAELGIGDEEVPGFAADLAELVRAGFVTRTADTRPSLHVAAVGRTDTGELLRAVAAGFRTVDDPAAADLVVLVCDDHADPRLPDALTDAASRSAVLLVRWGAGRCWIGPVVEPGAGHRLRGTCPGCLLAALRRNAEPDLAGAAHPVVPAGVALQRAAVGAVVGALDGLVPSGGADDEELRPLWRSAIRELRLHTFDVVVHPVPPCPREGSGPEEGVQPSTGTTDLLARIASETSDLTGVLAPPVVRQAASGRFLATTTHPVRARSANGVRWRRATAYGSGRTAEAALTACAGEAVERFSTSWRPDPRAVPTTAGELRRAGFEVVAVEGLRDDEPGEFRELRDVLDGRASGRWVPAVATTFGHPDELPAGAARVDSSGCAAGRTVADAVRRGLAELLERHAVASWWWSSARRPEVVDPDAGQFDAELARHGRTGWFLDLTTANGVPVVAAVGVDADRRAVTLGFGAATSRAGAVHRAGDELLQLLACLQFGDELGLAGAGTPQFQALRVDDLPHLLPHGRVEAEEGDPQDDLAVLRDWRSRLERDGVDVGYLDLTHPRLQVPVVRVVSSRLRSWRRPGGSPNPWDLPV
ncbi:YcaO-like family protein [Kineococcus sp. SYSU DK003]|uniref:YcaO-like family protein n=1 Tax=Kineococcus sp. SYSU DK003 TaxID=3383124 RepID=UPI003D7E9E58